LKKMALCSTAVLVSAMVLAGCSSNSGGNEAPSKSNAGSPSASTSETQPSDETKGAASPVTLEYFTQQQITPDGEKTINDRLHETYPNISVKFKHVADNYTVALKTRIASGDAPDLFDGNGYVANAGYVEPGYVLDLSDTGLIDSVLPQFQVAGQYNGKAYGLPTLAQATGMIYNKAVFEKAGIANPPKTLDELQQAIDKIRALGVTPIATGFKDVWVSHQMFWDVLGQNANGGDFEQWYQDMVSAKATFSTNEGLKKSFALLDLVKGNTFDRPLASDINNMMNNLATDKAGIAFQGVWTYPSNIVNINPDAPLGLAPIPISNNPEDAVMLYSAQGVMFVSKDTKKAEEAKSFLKWLTSKAGVEVYTAVNNQASPFKTDAELKIENPLSIDANQYVQNGGKTVGFIKTYWPTGFQDTVGKEMQRYIGGEIDRDGFLKSLDAKWIELTAKK